MAKKAKRPNASRSKNNDKARAARVPAKSASNPPAAKQLSSKGETSSNEHRLSVVGVGASAGGLEAFEQLLRALPDDTGLAFVLVQHLAPKHESMLSELLAKATRMPVVEVTQGMLPCVTSTTGIRVAFANNSDSILSCFGARC